MPKRPSKKPEAASVPSAQDTEAPDDSAPGEDEIVIENMGPIDFFRFTARPGVVTVLEGKNGDGKSLALEAVEAIGNKDVKLPKSDRATSGRVSGFGVDIRITASGQNKRSGEVVVESLNSRVNLGAIIDPHVADPVAADAVRIKEIVNLLGLVVGPEHVQKLLKGPALWNKHCSEVDETLPTVEFLGKVKRALEKGARGYEDDSKTLGGESAGLEQSLARIPESPLSVDDARRLHTEATERNVQAKTLANQAAEQATKREEARQKSGAAPSVLSVADAEKAVQAKAKALQDETAARDELRKLLDASESRVALAGGEHNAALSALEQARGHAAERADMDALLSASAIVAPSDSELIKLAQAETEAGEAVAVAIAAGRREPLIVQRDAKKTLAKEAADRGVLLRDTVEKLPSLLIDAIRSSVPGLKVDRDMRLVVEGTKRGECFVGELSHGERAALAMRLVAAACAESGEEPLVSLAQPDYEAMDGDAVAELQSNVAHFQIRLVTAAATKKRGADHGIHHKELNDGGEGATEPD